MLQESLRTTFILTMALVGACFSGPNQLEYYSGAPALTVHAHFAELPADNTAYATLDIAMLRDSDSATNQQGSLDPVEWSIPAASMSAGDAQFAVRSGGAVSDPFFLNSLSGGKLRFFRLAAGLWPTQGTSGSDTWSPLGFDLVWSAEEVTSYPFGPAYQSVSFPKGYSWLRRQCGPSPGQIQMDVRPIDETVVFQHVDPFLLWDTSYLETSERSFVASCGVVIPAQDLGTRISFDLTSTQPLVWSADGTRLYYLSQADPKDPARTVGLRQIKLADGVSSELVAGPLGERLQQDSAGQLYVGVGSQLFRVTPAATGPATLVALPFSGYAALSPDGQWFARYSVVGQSVRLWSVAAQADVATPDGSFVGWSPDSQAAFVAGTTLDVFSPANPTQQTVYETPSTNTTTSHEGLTAWSSQGPVLVQTPGNWMVDIAGYSNSVCFSCLGLSLQNLADGTVRQVLDASAGRIDLVSTLPVLDTVLVWAQQCLGLHDTLCTYSLIRVGLTTGTAQTVAVAADRYPVGLSPDGKRVAIAAPSGIYVKTLSP